MDITKEMVRYVGHLARIDLCNKELEILSGQLKDILDFIDKLKELEIKNVCPTSHILPVHNVLRDDARVESLLTDKALANAPQLRNNFFSVPKIIE